MILKIEKVLDKINPDCFFVLGDTNSALTSIVAKKKKFQYFIMKLEIVVSIKEFQKKLIEKLLTLLQI